MTDSEKPLTVLQSCNSWLPTTQKWLHTQVTALPAGIRSPIAARCRANHGSFPVEDLHVRDTNRPAPIPFGHLLKLMSKIGLFADSIERLQRRKWADFRREIARSLGVDILHSHFGHHAIRDQPVIESLGLAHVVSFYGYDASYLPRKHPEILDEYRRVFDSASVVLCEGPHFAETVESLGCPPDKIRVHHLGVDLEEHPYEPRRLNKPDDPVQILMAASFKQKKGLPDALEALGSLNKTHDIQVTLIGESDNSKRSKLERKRIRRAIDDGDFGDCLTHRGFVPYSELIEQMLDHHIFLSPSRTSDHGDTEGGAPVSIIAAQATGMPVVSTHHADIPNVVEHEKTGLLADEGSVPQLESHLKGLADTPESWETFGEQARRRMEREFDARKQGQRLGRIYRSLISG